MKKEIKRLGDAELEIMQAIWAADGPVSSAYVQTAMQGKRDWALAAIMTVLKRLCEKGFLLCTKEEKKNSYTALISQETYQRSEGKTVLEKLYAGSVTGLVAALYDGKSINDQDIAELRRFLDHWEDKK